LIRLLGLEEAVKLTGITAEIKNKDIRNWYATISAIFMYASKRYGKPIQALAICQDIRDCIHQNIKLFARERLRVPESDLLQIQVRGREAASIEKSLRKNLKQKAKKSKQKVIIKTLEFFTELLKNRVVNESFEIYNREATKSLGGNIHTGYDDTV